MNRYLSRIVCALAVVLPSFAMYADEPKSDKSKDGNIELFNGKDLTGWCYSDKDKEYINCISYYANIFNFN